MDLKQTLNEAIKLANDELNVIESSEEARAEAYANGRNDLFDENTENMIHNYRNFTGRIRQLLETGQDRGQAEPQTITGYDGHRPVREQKPSPERPRHKTTITDIANEIAVMTQQGRANWEPNGVQDSFRLNMGDVMIILSKGKHTPHPTISVMNDKGQVVDSYTASDFMGTLAQNLASLHRMASKQVYSTEQTLENTMTRLLQQK